LLSGLAEIIAMSITRLLVPTDFSDAACLAPAIPARAGERLAPEIDGQFAVFQALTSPGVPLAS
jgi:hypothetical protein